MNRCKCSEEGQAKWILSNGSMCDSKSTYDICMKLVNVTLDL